MPTKNNYSALTKKLLLFLTAVGKELISTLELLNDLHNYRNFYLWDGLPQVDEFKKLRDEKILRVTIQALKRRQYIKAKKIGKRLMFYLTDKGKMACLTEQLRQTKPNSKKFYTVVIFDIPESERLARRQLRWLLRQGNFIKLQQSVWASKTDTYELISKLVKDLKLQPWVNIFYATGFLNPHTPS
ncbi:MAG: CRISPR-associated endonuclease Cas2 [Candidatus Kerfeldbacteria bacterium]|nr:CRISPR-associated endonuclease Cas2 [Candidatus Kerfeldbacteria bacterium]